MPSAASSDTNSVTPRTNELVSGVAPAANDFPRAPRPWFGFFRLMAPRALKLGAVGPFAGVPLGILLIGLLCRFALAPYTSWSNDVAVWFHVSLSGFYGVHLYDRPGFSYPPVWGYCLQIVGAIVRLAGLGPGFFGVDNPGLAPASVATGDFSSMVTSPAFNLAFKGVLFLFDLGTGLTIWRFVALLTRDVTRAHLAFTLWFLNPFVIYESAVAGHFDGIVGFWVLATSVFLVLGRPFWGGAAWVVAILAKLSPVTLGLQILAYVLVAHRLGNSFWYRLLSLSLVGLGAAITAICLIGPEVVTGSVPAMLHNVVARGQGQVAVGGVTVFGIRHLRPWSWLLEWGYRNSSALVLTTAAVQFLATFGWGVWTLTSVRSRPAFALLAGSVGTLASLMLLSPSSNPQFVLWWLPELVVLVTIMRRGYLELGAISAAQLLFSIGVLGPAAVLAPLATYTNLVPASVLANAIIQWNAAPGHLWGLTLSDEFFAPAALVTFAALMSLFLMWLRLPHRQARRLVAEPRRFGGPKSGVGDAEAVK